MIYDEGKDLQMASSTPMEVGRRMETVMSHLSLQDTPAELLTL